MSSWGRSPLDAFSLMLSSRCLLPDAVFQLPPPSCRSIPQMFSQGCFSPVAFYPMPLPGRFFAKSSPKCPLPDDSSQMFPRPPDALSQVPPPRRLLLHGWSHWPQQGYYLRDFWGNDTSMNPTESQQRTHDALKVQKWLDLGIVNDRRRNPKKHHF